MMGGYIKKEGHDSGMVEHEQVADAMNVAFHMIICEFFLARW